MISNVVSGPSQRLTFEVFDLLNLLVQMLPCPGLQLLELRGQLLVFRAYLPVLEKQILVQHGPGGVAKLQKGKLICNFGCTFGKCCGNF